MKSIIDDIDMNSNELSLCDKFLSESEIKKLVYQLSEPNTIRNLNLKGNNLNNASIGLLSNLLLKNQSLVTISLEWNQLQSNSIISFANSIEQNHTLQYLDLRNNNISDEGAIALANSLKINKSIRSIDLRWNCIGDRGILAFKEAILDRSPPLNLLYDGNDITEETYAAMQIYVGNTITTSQSFKHTTCSMSETKDTTFSKSITDDNYSGETVIKAQYEILQRELKSLRDDYINQEHEKFDMKRQLDLSASQITDLEQQLIRLGFQNKQYSNTINQLNEKILLLNDDKRNLVNKFDSERNNLSNNFKSQLLDKVSEISKLSSQCESYSIIITKLEVSLLIIYCYHNNNLILFIIARY